MKIYEVKDGETQWVLANSFIDALKQLVELYGYKDVNEYFDSSFTLTIRQIPPSEQLTIDWDDEGKITKTAKEWAEMEHIQPVFASTCI